MILATFPADYLQTQTDWNVDEKHHAVAVFHAVDVFPAVDVVLAVTAVDVFPPVDVFPAVDVVPGVDVFPAVDVVPPAVDVAVFPADVIVDSILLYLCQIC